MRSGIINRSSTGMLEGPEDLFAFRDFIISKTSSLEIWAIIKFNWLRFLKNFSGGIFSGGVTGISLSVFGPTFTKKSFNPVATAFGSSIILSLILICDILLLVEEFVLIMALIPSHVFSCEGSSRFHYVRLSSVVLSSVVLSSVVLSSVCYTFLTGFERCWISKCGT